MGLFSFKFEPRENFNERGELHGDDLYSERIWRRKDLGTGGCRIKDWKAGRGYDRVSYLIIP